MAKKFLTINDLAMRLNKAICFYKGDPVYCEYREGSEDDTIHIKKISAGSKWKPIDYTSDDFCLGFRQLGNVNQNGKVYYASRAPGRSQKWGITKPSVLFRYRGQLTLDNTTTIFNSHAFGDTLRGVYPTLEYAISYAKSFPAGCDRMCAFHRNFNVDVNKFNKVYIMYQGDRTIGEMDKDNNVVLYSDLSGIDYIAKELKEIEGISVSHEKIM